MLEKKKKNYLFLIFKILLLIISCYLIYLNISNEENFFYVFERIEFKYFLIVLLLTVILTHIQIYVQLKSFFQKKMSYLTFAQYSKIFFNSQMISFILPHSGLLYKAYELKKFELSYKDFIGINLFLAWFYLFFFVAFYSFEILIFGHEVLKNYSFPIFLLGMCLSISIFYLPFLYKKFIKISFKNRIISKIYEIINYIVLVPLSIKKDKFYKFLSIYGILSHLLSFVVIYLLFLSINVDLKFSYIIIFFIINSFLDQVPITPKNLAISELIFGVVSSSVGLGFEFGVAIKILLRLFFFVNLVSLTIFYNAIDLKKKLNEK